MAQPRGWGNRSYGWLQTASGYTAYVASDYPTIDGTIYRKGTTDLPPGVAPPLP